MRLTVETGPLAGTTVSLDRDHPSHLGSGPDCVIRVQEAGVQPQHAVVKALRDQGFGIKALAPGVRLNGQQIEASPLKDGDVIEIGTTRIAFGQVQKRGAPAIAGYRILDELGRGGMGTVYRAEQTSLHREVALKVLSKELTSNPQFVAKFVAEARAAAKLQHPNVVQVFDVEHDGDLYYYAMELMHDGSLEDLLKQQGALEVDRALQVVADAAAGLAYAESLGIVHRDIKPDNLMLDQHGAVKIADLGLAGTGEETEEKAIGTPHFMAPEQVLRKAIDHRTDLYALGCTFYRLVTGRTPFRGHTVKDILRAQVKDEAEPAHKANPKVPVEVSAIIQKLMAKEPSARFQTANELLDAIELLLRPPAKKGTWIALASAGVLVAGGAIYWAVNKPTEVVTVEKRYDDPEKQQFADEIVALKAAAREDKATIAMLTARASGLDDLQLAAALERVATDHPHTRAAAEANDRAAQVRRDVAARERATQQQTEQLAQALGTLRQAIQGSLQQSDFGRALHHLDQPPPAAFRDDRGFADGVQRLRDDVLAAARARLDGLRAAIDSAQKTKDAAALAAAVDALADATANAATWPPSFAKEIDAVRQQVAVGRTALADLQREHRDSLWQQYHAQLLAKDGVAAALRRFDFAGAGAAATRFAQSVGEDESGAHAAAFAAAAAQADAFAAALANVLVPGQLQYRTPEGASMQAVRWDRDKQLLAVADATRKPLKEQLVPAAAVAPAVWAALAEQVPADAPGSRECFVGLVALLAHADAARAYLGRLQAHDDASGTGAASYPLGANLLAALLRRLPEDGKEPWQVAIRRELAAGQRLAAGLRALSEKRNLAAAGHLDQLIGQYPHSLVVALLQ